MGNLNKKIRGLFLIIFHNGMVGNLDARLGVTLLYTPIFYNKRSG